MTENPQITTNWRPIGGEPSSAWRRLADKLLANRKKKPAGTGEATRNGECKNGTERHGTKSGNKIGRKRYDVPFAIVCKALQACCGNYSAAARWIFEETGIKVSPGFVQTRVQREDKTLEDILGQPLQSLAPKSGQKQLAKEG